MPRVQQANGPYTRIFFEEAIKPVKQYGIFEQRFTLLKDPGRCRTAEQSVAPVNSQFQFWNNWNEQSDRSRLKFCCINN